LDFAGCTESCSATLQAAGFDYQCETVPNQNYSIEQSQTANVMWSNISYIPSQDGGAMNFTTNFVDGLSSTTNFSINYSSGGAFCTNSYTSVACALRLAQVKYPVTVNKGVAKLARWLPGSNETIALQAAFNESYDVDNTPSTLGGLATTVGNLFTASADLTLDSAGADVDGMLASLYLKTRNTNETSCNIAWSDPTVDVINAIRELMFRTATAASNASSIQTTIAQQTSLRAVYVSHYSWLGGAIIVMMLTIIAVAPLFLGWWHLGRSVSLSPIETAKAFEAPLLHGDAYNADADLLLEEVGMRRLRYGEAAFVESSGRRLRLGEPSQTVQPTPGQLYGGSTRQWHDTER